MKKAVLVLFAFITIGCNGQQKKTEKNEEKTKFAVVKSDAEWKKILSPEAYEVLRNKDTEPAFVGEYTNTFDKGIYVCAACNNKLFNSDSKFHSDCGWPSFDKAIKGSVIYKTDSSFGMDRTEVMCANCGGHLGHVFDDGPTATAQRFCTNSISVKFIKQ